jgi:hypothetical protein
MAYKAVSCKQFLGVSITTFVRIALRHGRHWNVLSPDSENQRIGYGSHGQPRSKLVLVVSFNSSVLRQASGAPTATSFPITSLPTTRIHLRGCQDNKDEMARKTPFQGAKQMERLQSFGVHHSRRSLPSSPTVRL